MGNWRNHGEGPHHHWSISSSSNNKKTPLKIWRPTVPRWEKMFCASVGITWPKLVETKKNIYVYENVMKWDDSAGREAFDNAKKRFWASMNNLPCDIPLPDPNTYVDDLDWNSIVDPELVLELEKDVTRPNELGKNEKVVIIDGFTFLNQSFSDGGSGEYKADTPKHTELVSSAQVYQYQNNNVCLGTQYYTPCYAHYQPTKNYTWGWNQREHYPSYTYEMGRGAGWNRKAWYGDNRKEENITWHKAPEYPDRIEYQMGNEGRNNGVRRGNFAYYRPRGRNAPNA